MVINENELITENQETHDNNLINDTMEHKESNSSDKVTSDVNNEDIKENEQSEQSEQSEQKETAETNCLALTVRKNYNISIIKNSIFTSLRLSFKIAISTIALNILKLFL